MWFREYEWPIVPPLRGSILPHLRVPTACAVGYDLPSLRDSFEYRAGSQRISTVPVIVRFLESLGGNAVSFLPAILTSMALLVSSERWVCYSFPFASLFFNPQRN